jgi:pentatricopeptide repeat protein
MIQGRPDSSSVMLHVKLSGRKRRQYAAIATIIADDNLSICHTIFAPRTVPCQPITAIHAVRVVRHVKPARWFFHMKVAIAVALASYVPLLSVFILPLPAHGYVLNPHRLCTFRPGIRYESAFFPPTRILVEILSSQDQDLESMISQSISYQHDHDGAEMVKSKWTKQINEPSSPIQGPEAPEEPLYDWDITLKSFNADLHNLALEDPVKAHDAVEIMLDLYRKDPESPRTVQPDATCFTTVMDGYVHAGKIELAQTVLDQMERFAATDLAEQVPCNSTTATSRFSPTDLTYILMVQAWANDYREDYTGSSAEKAVAILRRMQSAWMQRQLQSATDTPEMSQTQSLVKAWTIVVEGWCKRSGIARQAMQRAEELLQEMEDDATPEIERPNVLTYTSYIGGLSRCRQGDLARKAEQVLERMERHGVQPDMVAYTSVINCWSRAASRRERSMAATRALCILSDMERMYIVKRMYNVKPSMITYATAIAAIGNSLQPDAPQMAEDVLKRMQKLHESGDIANLKPGTAIYNAVIYALSQAPVSNRLKYAQRAEQILDEMSQRAQRGEPDVQPDVRTWAAVLRAWARSKQPDAAENAQRVLDKMEYRYKKGISPVRPNFVCCTTVMGAWGQSSSELALDKLERILHHMEESYEKTLEPDIRPNTVSYITVCFSFSCRFQFPLRLINFQLDITAVYRCLCAAEQARCGTTCSGDSRPNDSTIRQRAGACPTHSNRLECVDPCVVTFQR